MSDIAKKTCGPKPVQKKVRGSDALGPHVPSCRIIMEITLNRREGKLFSFECLIVYVCMRGFQ
jgi:hypothetical protein